MRFLLAVVLVAVTGCVADAATPPRSTDLPPMGSGVSTVPTTVLSDIPTTTAWVLPSTVAPGYDPMAGIDFNAEYTIPTEAPPPLPPPVAAPPPPAPEPPQPRVERPRQQPKPQEQPQTTECPFKNKKKCRNKG